MSSESPGGTKSSSDQISTDDDEDKKFVSQAVTFMIGHARNGFVSLCASVASLLKEQSRLKQEVETLQQEVLLSRDHSPKHNKFKVKVKVEINEVGENSNPYISDLTSCTSQKSVQHIPESASPIKVLKQLSYRKIKGCLCSLCSVNKVESSLKMPLEKGMKVIIRGKLCGVVEYVGHVEMLDFPEIQVGIKFSEAIGNSDGKVQKKVYFSVPKNHGAFIPLSHVLCIIR